MDIQQRRVQVLDSREVAELVEKGHSELLKDIRRYCEQLGQGKIPQSDFFTESTYINSQNKVMPCYSVTKKGCEFIAHKLTGTKGTIFTARYIDRFHEMQNILTGQDKSALPWFIKYFDGKYIVLMRDFNKILGIDIVKDKDIFRKCALVSGEDYNGWGWKNDNDSFVKEYGFEFGSDPCMKYLSLRGALKVIRILENDNTMMLKESAVSILRQGIESVLRTAVKGETAPKQATFELSTKDNKDISMQININLKMLC